MLLLFISIYTCTWGGGVAISRGAYYFGIDRVGM